MLIITPLNIANKNINVIGSNIATEDTAGPGHKPTNPHPIPKRQAPINNFLSKSFFCGNFTSIPKEDFFLCKLCAPLKD